MTELGNRLKETRESKGLSLEDLQEATKIQKRYLVGIEEGNYSMMPGKFYVRAFIKQYCEAVGLEPDEIFEEYKSEVPSVYTEEIPEQLSRVNSRNAIGPDRSKVTDLLPKILVGAVAVGAVVLVWVLVSNFMGNQSEEKPSTENSSGEVGFNENDQFDKEKANNTETEDQDKEEKESENKKEEEDSSKQDETDSSSELSAVSSSGKTSIYELKNAEKFNLKVSSTGATWVGVSNGEGKLVFQGTLNKDQSEELDFSDESEAVIKIGNAPDAEIFVNDEKLKFSISPTEVTTQTVTIQFKKEE